MEHDIYKSPKPWQHVLTFYELSEWCLTLVTGHTITIYADGRSREDGYLVFDTLIEGIPRKSLILAKVPEDLVKNSWTPYVGRTTPEGPPGFAGEFFADAIRDELATGKPIDGEFHSQKGKQLLNTLNNWLRNNPDASPEDIKACKTSIAALQNALNST